MLHAVWAAEGSDAERALCPTRGPGAVHIIQRCRHDVERSLEPDAHRRAAASHDLPDEPERERADPERGIRGEAAQRQVLGALLYQVDAPVERIALIQHGFSF